MMREEPSTVDKVECVVIGAGVIGLAVGRALAQTGREVIVLEKNARFGEETSARNSEVIHAGIYYPKGSLKARTCVDGKALLYAYLRERALPHRRCGKVIVASNEAQIAALRDIRSKAQANGVHDLEMLDRAALSDLEPAVSGAAALLSPSTGILDSHALMLSLLGDLEAASGMLACGMEFREARREPSGFTLRFAGADDYELHTKLLINAGGLRASLVDEAVSAPSPSPAPRTRFAKGSYFSLSGAHPFNRLIYPVPEPGGLGVHLTLDLGGAARFGPNVEWLGTADPSEIDYSVDESLRLHFAEAIRRYWPDLPEDRLHPDYAGARPKLVGPGDPAGDFLVETERQHGVANYVRLLGIESPGLTASLALAQSVVRALQHA